MIKRVIVLFLVVALLFPAMRGDGTHHRPRQRARQIESEQAFEVRRRGEAVGGSPIGSTPPEVFTGKETQE